MRHIFKADGPYNKGDETYDCKCVGMNEEAPKGWFNNLEDALKSAATKPKSKSKTG
jgi:hypothetical protein